MHRFRKKSETRRSGQVPFSASTEALDTQEPLPQLPLQNDFRTSLIIPDLSRRFSLLRSSSGDLVTLEALKTRLAEQRARGAENQVTEEEEDMILETLRGMRSKATATAQKSQESVVEEDDPSIRQSVQSTGTIGSSLAPSSVSSSPSGRSTKRYSNNLFGSGRFRDYTYMRSVTKNGSTRTQSFTPTESSLSQRENVSSIVDSLRPTTPEGSNFSSSAQSSPNERVVRSAPLVPSAPYTEPSISVAEYRISKTLGPTALKRASLALEEAIKEIEEEAEDEIVMPRSTPIPRASLDHPSQSAETVRNSDLSQSSSVFEAGMAITSDKQTHNDLDERRASPVPSRILPGYIPGMPRPMTPRDFDFDEQRSHSTTPRATSPTAASFVDSSATSIPNNIPSNLLRRNSASSQSRSSPHPMSPTSPLFLQRSTTGRRTPEDSNWDGLTTEFESPLNSSILTRRRPASPLSSPPFQPMAVSSRPSTPSNIIWTARLNNHTLGHKRDDSWNSDGGISSSDVHGALNSHNNSGGRSLKSPALPDSPIIDSGHSTMNSFSSASNDTNPEERPGSKMSITDLGAPRSATPTQNTSRSPTSSGFSDFGISSKSNTKRSSRQNAPSSPFNLGPIPPLVFSPLVNSSRSSLESAGSSYHSWEEKDRYSTLFSDADVQQPAWHDISASDKSSSATPEDSPDGEWDAEEIIARYAGLKRSDFMAIQEKLVAVAATKSSSQERAPSAMRRRRPSTSQSNYSVNGREHRVASPPPQTTPASPSVAYKTEQQVKASALLNSVVDSIQSNSDQPSIDTTNAPPASLSDKEISPTSRRNRDLAQALFGREGPEEQAPKPEQPPVSPTSNPASPTDSNSRTAPSFTTPYQISRNPSTPRVPQTAEEEAELAREVQEKMNAATLALKRPPPDSGLSLLSHGSSVRKRISPHQISNPRLVSAPTSVDTVPLPRTPSLSSAHNSGPSSIGSRFKKLRGTLRAKNPLPSGEEVTPYPLDIHSPLSIQTNHDEPARHLKVPGPVAMSATETRFKVPIPSPPASAGPGLKGFMARFRGKQRMPADTSSDFEQKLPQLSAPLTSPVSRTERTFSPPLLSPKTREAVSSTPTLRPTTPQARSGTPAPQNYRDNTDNADSNESTAIRQLFDAATNLGLDQGALNDLLARSTSTSSRSTNWTLLARNNSNARPGDNSTDNSRLASSLGRPSIGDQSLRTGTPDPNSSNRRPSPDAQGPRDGSISRQPSERKQPDHVRRPREGQKNDNRATSAVIRRTIIFPSDMKSSPADFNALMRKTSSRRKRASATSISTRSVHDRAPTPPPPRSPTTKRFSNGPPPPVPHLPNSLLPQPDNLLNAPSTSAGGSIEKSNSTYDSLYDMYSGESRAASSAAHDPNAPDTSLTQADMLPSSSESGPALEVIELANGETIWSIVNGLRDDDEESVYTGRASFASEYSNREASTEGGLQIFVKEHGRSGSKGSNSSFLSRKKTLQGKPRPETKVFYSSSAQIGRLIENLSQGMEAGSFNFLPNRAPGHSASSSLSTNDLHWTVEERLEHMLGSMQAPEPT